MIVKDTPRQETREGIARLQFTYILGHAVYVCARSLPTVNKYLIRIAYTHKVRVISAFLVYFIFSSVSLYNMHERIRR